MNKSALRKFATEAREELLERVELEARKIGITKNKIEEAVVESSDAIIINENPLSAIERSQRDQLIDRIEKIGFDRVMEEAAYTWFNRLIALRFMEVNDYLPVRVRVLSSEYEDRTEPDLMTEALSLDLDIDRDYVYTLTLENKTDELFKYLIKTLCDDLHQYMPFMFGSTGDYTSILFPDGLLGPDSFIRKMTDTEKIPEEDWKQIEIIGWLYQFYIANEKDRVFAAKRKYKAKEIPFATQLFTPDWIVQYMVENSLGRYWIESHPEHADLKENWHFFINHQQKDYDDKIEPSIHKNVNIEEIKCLDPAMGSGHILIYMFDVLFAMYRKAGYMKRDIPRLIIEKNLYGLDIDDRAYQLACFSIIMKAMEYNRRFLRSIAREGLTLNVASIQETNHFSDQDIAFLTKEERGETFDQVKAFIEQFHSAKSIGSLIKIKQRVPEFLIKRLEEIKSTTTVDLLEADRRKKILEVLPKLIKQVGIMNQSYDILITNPPYMSASRMNKELSNYLNKEYPAAKADLFAAFMEIDHLMKENSLYAAVNQHSWMFLSTFKALREKVIQHKTIDSMLHLGPRAFQGIGGEVVQSTAFVLRNQRIHELEGEYIRLVDFRNAQEKKIETLYALEQPDAEHRFTFVQKDFMSIPGSPISYWVQKENIERLFKKSVFFDDLTHAFQGIITGNNQKYLRHWFEVEIDQIAFGYQAIEQVKKDDKVWIPYNKGGGYQKWYGNNVHVLYWINDGEHLTRSRSNNKKYYLREGVTWSYLTSSQFSARYFPDGFLWDVAGSSIFSINENFSLLEIVSLMNSKITKYILEIYNPTLNFQVENILKLPYIQNDLYVEEMKNLAENNIQITKQNWDAFEISWDFEKHPFLIFKAQTIESAFNQWKEFTERQFDQLKENEEALNRIFIDLYGLQEELTPNVKETEVSVRKANIERDVKSFISYAVGCMFGRYSLDEEGLVYAGGEFDPTRYQSFPAVEDNIIPVVEGIYFKEDIVHRFVKFVEVTYGKETLEENLRFIAEAIGKRKSETPRETLRRYFITQSQFYRDHVRTYHRTPIYWLFTSGPERAFNCFIYMHRYDRMTLSRMRTDYVHNVQIRYEAEREALQAIIESDASAKEIREAKKEITSIDRKLEELKTFDETLGNLADQQIEIDFSEGVRENYKKFIELLAKL